MKASPRRMGRVFCVATIVAAAFGVAPAVAATTPKVISARTGASVILSDTAGVRTIVESLTLAKGSWTISSNITVVDFGSGDFVRCLLDDAGTVLDGGATTYVANTVADLANSATVKAAAPFTVTLDCSHDANATSGNQFYVDPGATLLAVNGGPINGPAATVVQRHTTAATPLPQTVKSPVTSFLLAAGSWDVRANLSAVSFGGTAFINCTLSSGGQSSSVEVGVGNADDLVSDLVVQNLFVLGAAARMALNCYAYQTDGVYIDPGATLIATLVAPANVLAGTTGTGTLSDTGGAQTKVFHKILPAGNWRVSSAATAYLLDSNGGIGGGTDFVRCQFLAGSNGIDGGATVRISKDDPSDFGNYEQAILNTGTFSAKKPWTLSLSCAHDATIATGAHWTIALSSPVIAIQQGPIQSTIT